MTEYTTNFGLALPNFRQGPWHDLINSDLKKIDALLYSALSGQDVHPWENDTVYTEGLTIVDDTDASIWMCSVNHTSSAEPTTFAEERLAHPTYWIRLLTGFAPRGQWQNATQYFPYDLTYDSALGIFALCTTKHDSVAVGNIKDDAIYWAFLVDMSSADLSTAIAVTYDDTASGLNVDNVQDAIDKLEVQIVQMNTININQGNAITTLQGKDTTHDTQIAAIQLKNTQQDDKNTAQDAKDTDLQNQINALNAEVDAIPTVTFPVGTRMVFIQSAPPTGWTQSTAYNDRAIRLVSGATGGNAAGAVGFATMFSTTVTGGRALSIAELPNHALGGGKTMDGPGGDITQMNNGANPDFGAFNFSSQGSVGSGVAHTHPLDLRVAYVDACVGVKA